MRIAVILGVVCLALLAFHRFVNEGDTSASLSPYLIGAIASVATIAFVASRNKG